MGAGVPVGSICCRGAGVALQYCCDLGMVHHELLLPAFAPKAHGHDLLCAICITGPGRRSAHHGELPPRMAVLL